MKIAVARIKHYRCGDYENSLLVSIPEEMTFEELEKLINEAMHAAVDAELVADKKSIPRPRKEELLKTLPKDTTIQGLEEAYTYTMEQYEKAQKNMAASRKSFATWLEELSEGRVIGVGEVDLGEFEVTCNWGCNHGLNLDYSSEG